MNKSHYQYTNYQLYGQINTRECVLTHVHPFFTSYYQSTDQYMTKGIAQDRHASQSIFFSFSCSFRQKFMPSNRLAPLPSWVGDPFWEILDPPLQKWVVPTYRNTNPQVFQVSKFTNLKVAQ